MNNNFVKIIKEICEENHINYKFISKDFVTILEKDNKIRYLFGYKFDLNNHALGLILDDKYATYDLLKSKNIPAVEHQIVYSKNNHNNYAKNCNSYEYVYNYFKENNNNIVIKPNNGTCGNGVYHIKNETELYEVLDKIFLKHNSISICPFYEIKNEYRFIILNSEVKLDYAKYNPKVIGNSKKTIKDLLLEFNYNYFKDRLNGDEYKRVLKDKEEFVFDWKFNLSCGAICKEIFDKKLEEKLKKLAISIAKEINLKFGSIDIIETTDNKIKVLEINSGVMIENFISINKNGYNIAKNIYKDAIESMFN